MKIAAIGIGGYILYDLYETYFGAGAQVQANAASTTPNIPQSGVAVTPAPSNLAISNTGTGQGTAAQQLNMRSHFMAGDVVDPHGGVQQAGRLTRMGVAGLGGIFTGPYMALGMPVTHAGVVSKGMQGLVRATSGERAVAQLQ